MLRRSLVFLVVSSMILGAGVICLAQRPYDGVVINIAVVRDHSHEVALRLLHESDFEETTGITVRESLLEFEEMVQAEKIGFLAGTGTYDLVGIDQPQIGEYAQNGWVKPMDEYIADPSLPDPQIEDIIPSVLDTCGTWDGQIYALPVSTYGNLFGYRVDLFEASGLVDWDGRALPPVTWEEYLWYGEKLMEDNPGMYAAVMQARKGEYLSYDVGTTLWEFGSGYINGDDVYIEDYPMMRVIWDKPEGLAALAFYKEVYERLAPPETINYDIARFVAAMQSGNIAMGVLIAEAVGEPLEDPQYSRVAGKMAYAQVPGKKQPDGSLVRISHIGGVSLAINSDSRHPEAAYLVARYLSGPEIAAEYSLAGGKPYRFSHFTEEAMAKFPWLGPQQDNIANGNARPKIPEYPAVSDIFSTAFHRVLSGDGELVAVMTAAAAEANALLAEAYP